MKVYDFCDPSRADMVWTRPEIESKLNSLVDNPPVYNTIMEAYPHAYITMTAERDKERCGDGALVSGYEISNYINHLLADIMTRYLHKITKDCAENLLFQLRIMVFVIIKRSFKIILSSIV